MLLCDLIFFSQSTAISKQSYAARIISVQNIFIHYLTIEIKFYKLFIVLKGYVKIILTRGHLNIIGNK